ncbi:MAG: CNNM domain-containing protein [bacterium]
MDAATHAAGATPISWTMLGILLLLVVLSGFFSGSETAVVSVSRARLQSLASAGKRDARRALRLVADTPGTIACLLVGTNLCNVGASSLATALALSVSARHGVALATLVMTPLVLVVGEILPKAFYRSRPMRRLRASADALLAFRFALAPAVWVASGATRLLLSLLPISAAEQRPIFRRDDLENLFLYGTVRGERGGPAGEWFRMAGRALELGRRRTSEAMIPLRPERTCPVAGSVGDALERFRAGGMRYLAALDAAGNVEGFIAAKSLLGADPAAPVAPFVRAAYVLDPNERLDEAIQGFRRHQQSIALVRDHDGRSLGLVTTEDVLEEVVGELPRMGLPRGGPRPPTPGPN